MACQLRHYVENDSSTYVLLSTSCTTELFHFSKDGDLSDWTLLSKWIEDNEIIGVDLKVFAPKLITIIILSFEGTISIIDFSIEERRSTRRAVWASERLIFGGAIAFLDNPSELQAVAIVGQDRLFFRFPTAAPPQCIEASVDVPEDNVHKNFQTSAVEVLVITLCSISIHRQSVLCKFKSMKKQSNIYIKFRL